MSINETLPETAMPLLGDNAMINGDAHHIDQENNGKSVLQSVLWSADRRFKLSQSVKEQAEEEHIEAEFLRNLNDKDSGVIDDLNSALDSSEPDVDMDVSARVLDLKNKLAASKSVHTSILKGADVLKSLADRAGQVTDYVAKLEIDIEKLEGVEAHHEKLKSAAAKLAQEYRDQGVVNSELKQSLAELNTQHNTIREELETARIDVSCAADERNRLQDDLATSQAILTKVENDKLNLQEKVVLWERGYSDVKENYDQSALLVDELNETIAEKDKKIAHQITKLLGMDQSTERLQAELAETRAKYDGISSSHVIAKAKLKETSEQLEAERSEQNAKNCLNLKRISELETQNQVLNRQIALDEDIIAKLDHQLNGGLSEPPVSSKVDLLSANEKKSSKKEKCSKKVAPRTTETVN